MPEWDAVYIVQIVTQGALSPDIMAEMKKLWDGSDRDGSGELNFEEFETVLGGETNLHTAADNRAATAS